MHFASLIFSWVAVVGGFYAAWLWYRASVVVIRQGDPRSEGGFFRGNPKNPDEPPIDVYSTVSVAAATNKQAAIATAITISIQAIATIFDKLA
jgi:hypothetical protein